MAAMDSPFKEGAGLNYTDEIDPGSALAAHLSEFAALELPPDEKHRLVILDAFMNGEGLGGYLEKLENKALPQDLCFR